MQAERQDRIYEELDQSGAPVDGAADAWPGDQLRPRFLRQTAGVVGGIVQQPFEVAVDQAQVAAQTFGMDMWVHGALLRSKSPSP